MKRHQVGRRDYRHKRMRRDLTTGLNVVVPNRTTMRQTQLIYKRIRVGRLRSKSTGWFIAAALEAFEIVWL